MSHARAADAGVGRVLLELARPYRRGFAAIALLALLGTAADLVAPLVYREVVNDIAGLFVAGGEAASRRAAPPDAEEFDVPADRAPHARDYVAPRSADQALETLVTAVLVLLVVNVGAHGAELLADQRTTRLSSRMEADVIRRSFAHALALPLQHYAKRPSAAVARQIDQLDQVAPIVSAAAREVAPELIRTIGVLAIMCSQSGPLTLAALAMLPPYLLVVRRSASRLQSGLDGYYELWERISARIQEALAAIKTVKLAGAESREVARLAGETEAAYAIHVERSRLGNVYLFWQTAAGYVGQALVLGYGGWLVLQRQLTPGDVVMFVAYLDRLFAPIESLADTVVTLQDHLASFRRAVRLQATGPVESGGREFAGARGEVEFRGVGFGYAPKRRVLDDLSFVLPAGRVTALVGPSGAGKTTIADLLLKLYRPDSGEIRLDGQRLDELDPAAVRRRIGVVAADGVVFSGTLGDNLRYKRPEASDPEVEAAARAAGLGDLLARLPEGLATAVGERGLGLSVGERQRLQIARVLVAQPLVLVLDEATANLDYATERDVRRALLEREGRPTTLVIAHRYSMVQDADHVIVLERGRPAVCGTPDEVRERSEWFARFAAGQAGERGRGRRRG